MDKNDKKIKMESIPNVEKEEKQGGTLLSLLIFSNF